MARHDIDSVLRQLVQARVADELAGAFLVNPHDIVGLKDTIARAAGTGPVEARRRMRTMRKRVFEHDVARWATGFLDTLSRVPGNAGGLP